MPDRHSGNDKDLDNRLSQLKDQLQRQDKSHRSEVDPQPMAQTRAKGIGLAFRMVSDLVAGVVVGAFLGWSVDSWFATSPFGLVILLMLGFAAGLMNVIRTAAKISREGQVD